MTKVKRSLAVLLALIMVLTIAPINSFALSSEIFKEASLEDGTGTSAVLTPVIYRNVNVDVEGAEENWQPTTKVKPGEEVRVRVNVQTDYKAATISLMFAFDNRIFTGDETLGTTVAEPLSVNTDPNSVAALNKLGEGSEYTCYRGPSPLWDDFSTLENWYTIDENGDVVGVPYVDDYTYNNYDWINVMLVDPTGSYISYPGTEWVFEIPLKVLDKPVVTPLIAEGETEASVEENIIETEGMIDEEVEETNPDETEDEGETIVSE